MVTARFVTGRGAHELPARSTGQVGAATTVPASWPVGPVAWPVCSQEATARAQASASASPSIGGSGRRRDRMCFSSAVWAT
jgi:hypothetical protein